jgi:hypothetical protein
MDPGSHVRFQISTKNTNLVEDHPMNISGKFGWILFSGFIRISLVVDTFNLFLCTVTFNCTLENTLYSWCWNYQCFKNTQQFEIKIFYSNFDKYPGWLSDLLFFWKMPSNHTLLEPEQQSATWINWIKTGWFGIRIMCPSGATCLPADCCFGEIAL